MAFALGSATLPAGAASATYLYQNQQIVFSHLASSNGVTMVGIQDPGLRGLLKTLGAIVTWRPGRRYVLITTAEPEVISFAVGDRNYDVGPVTSQASVAPFARADDVYLPLDALLRALYLAPKPDGSRTVLQPQLGSIDVRAAGTRAKLVAHAGAPLAARVVSESVNRIVADVGRAIACQVKGGRDEGRVALCAVKMQEARRVTARPDDGNGRVRRPEIVSERSWRYVGHDRPGCSRQVAQGKSETPSAARPCRVRRPGP